MNRKLLWNRFGRITTRHLEHTAAPLRRSVVAQMEQEFPAEFAKTAASTFRAADNISVTNSFYHYYALLTGPRRHPDRGQGAVRGHHHARRA